MPTRDMFCKQEPARLGVFPEAIPEDLIRFFTLSTTRGAFAASMRSPSTMLEAAVQLGTLPWLGFVPAAAGR